MRITRPTATSTRLSWNGTRQPHEVKASGESVAESSVIPPVPSTRPSGTPSWAKLPNRPRLRWSPHSIAISTDPLHSPPIASPWISRSATSSSGAAKPIVAVLGNMPTSADEMPMTSSVTISVALRPTRSPQCPKIAAPTGRAANPTA
jgi:hypothetical protein